MKFCEDSFQPDTDDVARYHLEFKVKLIVAKVTFIGKIFGGNLVSSIRNVSYGLDIEQY